MAASHCSETAGCLSAWAVGAALRPSGLAPIPKNPQTNYLQGNAVNEQQFDVMPAAEAAEVTAAAAELPEQPAPEASGDAPPDMPEALTGDTYSAALGDFVKAYVRAKSVNGQLNVNAAELEIARQLIGTELEVIKDFISFNLPGGRTTFDAACASAYRARIQGMQEAPRIQVAR